MRGWPVLAAALAGCSFVSPAEWDGIRDRDGDGAVGTRFGGPDCRDENRAVKDCDRDGDGFVDVAHGGDDCDDRDAGARPDRLRFRDADLDGHGDPSEAAPFCQLPLGWVDADDDCDDDAPAVHPGAPETCDDVDRDCTGDPYDVPTLPLFYVDGDADGFGGERAGSGCAPPPGHTSVPGDCDDADDRAHPGAVEVWYDGTDEACDGGDDWDRDGDGHPTPEGGGADCNDLDADVSPGATEVCNGVDDDCDGERDDTDPLDPPADTSPHYADADRDGYGDPLAPPVPLCTETVHAGYVLNALDCLDTDASASPVGVERCNNRDDDCDGVPDDDPVDRIVVYADADGDGWGADPLEVCFLGDGQALRDGDCNDADDTVWPGAPERCGDDVRQDCSTFDPDDCDRDGALPPVDCLDDPSVDPRAPRIHPGAAEVCDGLDNDCDGLFDGEEVTDPQLYPNWYVDLDRDGFGGDLPASTRTCSPPGPGTAPNTADCDDARGAVHPGGHEACNGLDDDCDGTVDDVAPADATAWFEDLDLDGFGSTVSAAQCEPPPGSWARSAGDCDDADPSVAPFVPESCNGLDDDCDGRVDDDDPDLAELRYVDGDRDGWGLTSHAVRTCAPAADGLAAAPGDCDDADPARHPGAEEVCNGGADDDCDGLGDENDPSLGGAGVVASWPDVDRDGYGDAAVASVERCTGLPGWATVAGDCDDQDPSFRPGIADRCPVGDENCDGVEESAGPTVEGQYLGFRDDDGDTWGDPTALEWGCGLSPALVALAGDCDDDAPDRFPFAPEVCDGADDDCDGRVDDADPTGADSATSGTRRFVSDADHDGFGADGSDVWACAGGPDDLPWDGARPDDCDDADAGVSPIVPEVCDGKDNDCQNGVDLGALDATSLYDDLDQDTFGAGAPSLRCATASTSPVGGDCDDLDDSVTTGSDYCPDLDTDGFADPSACVTACSTPPGDWFPAGGLADCDDGDSGVNPAAPETCDHVDQDCDTAIDDGVTVSLFADLDDDGFGDPGAPLDGCFGDDFTSLSSDDCDDAETLVGPAALYRADVDGDGHADPAGVQSLACPNADGTATAEDDCDDDAPDVYPGAPEVCDTVDNDCDGPIDEEGCPLALWWPDAEGDGFGDWAADPIASVGSPGPGYVDNPLDCSDGVAGDVNVVDVADAAALGAAWAAETRTCVWFRLTTAGGWLLPATGTVTGTRMWRVAPTHGLAVTISQPLAATAFEASGGANLVVHGASLVQRSTIAPLFATSGAGAAVLAITSADIDANGTGSDTVVQSAATHSLLVEGVTVHDSSQPPPLARGPLPVPIGGRVFAIEGHARLRWVEVDALAQVFSQGTADLAVDESAFTRVTTVGLSTTKAGATVGVTLQGVRIEGATLDLGGSIGGSYALADVTVLDAPGTGLRVSGTADVDVDGLVIENAGASGIDLSLMTSGTWSFADLEVRGSVGDGVYAPTVGRFSPLTITGLLVADAGGNGVYGSNLTLVEATVVGGSVGVRHDALGSGMVVRDAIVWGASLVDLAGRPGGGGVTADHVVWGTSALLPALAPSLGDPGFVRFDPAATSDTWDLRPHPLSGCTDADDTGTTGGPVGYFAPLDATDGDGDTMADAWETVWFGDTTPDGSGDADADADTDAAEYGLCTDPAPYP